MQGTSTNEAIVSTLTTQDDIFKMLYTDLLKAQQQMKTIADKKRIEATCNMEIGYI